MGTPTYRTDEPELGLPRLTHSRNAGLDVLVLRRTR